MWKYRRGGRQSFIGLRYCFASDANVTRRSLCSVSPEYLYKRSEYATSWSDERYPEWQEFLEVGSKRKYYHNRIDNSVSWTNPSNPDEKFDIIEFERKLKARPLSKVAGAVPANLAKRGGAALIDLLVSGGLGCVFASAVYVDLGQFEASVASIGFTGWVLFLFRDILYEQGTRSIGKKVMKIEIITNNGTLPSRYNNFFRQIYLPLYAGAALLMPYILALPVIETGCVLFTEDSKRIGDFIGQTKVIKELGDREKRLEEKKEIDAEEELLD